MPTYQNLVFQPQVWKEYIYIRFLFMGCIFYFNFIIFEIVYCNIVTFKIEVTWQVMWRVLIFTSTFTFFQAKLCSTTLTMPLVKVERRCRYPRTYMTWTMYFHSLICTQLRLSNLSADRPLVKAWDLPPLSTTVCGEVEKPVGCNWPLLFVMRRQLFYWIAWVVARWQKPKAGKPMATGLDGSTSWRLWFWYTIECIRARLGRVKSEVDKKVYLEHQQYISGIRYWISNDKGLGWKIQNI